MTNHPVNLKKESLPKVTNKKQDILFRLWMTGAAIGLMGGTFISIAAVFLTICDFFLSYKFRGSWLLLTVLPLWVFGAHCLDKAEDAENKFP